MFQLVVGNTTRDYSFYCGVGGTQPLYCVAVFELAARNSFFLYGKQRYDLTTRGETLVKVSVVFRYQAEHVSATGITGPTFAYAHSYNSREYHEQYDEDEY